MEPVRFGDVVEGGGGGKGHREVPENLNLAGFHGSWFMSGLNVDYKEGEWFVQ